MALQGFLRKIKKLKQKEVAALASRGRDEPPQKKGRSKKNRCGLQRGPGDQLPFQGRHHRRNKEGLPIQGGHTGRTLTPSNLRKPTPGREHPPYQCSPNPTILWEALETSRRQEGRAIFQSSGRTSSSPISRSMNQGRPEPIRFF